MPDIPVDILLCFPLGTYVLENIWLKMACARDTIYKMGWVFKIGHFNYNSKYVNDI